MKYSIIAAFALLLAQATLLAPAYGKNPHDGLSGKKGPESAGSETITTMAYTGCYDSGSYAYCEGPIRNVNINQSLITFTLDLPGSEISKLSCAAGNTFANFYLGNHDNYNEMYDALRYAMAHNNHIRIGITGGAYNCTVSYMHAFPAP